MVPVGIKRFVEENMEEFRNRVAIKFNTLPFLLSEIKDDKVFIIPLENPDDFETLMKNLQSFKNPNFEMIFKVWFHDKKNYEYEVILDNLKKTILQYDLSMFEDSSKIKKFLMKDYEELKKESLEFMKKIKKDYKELKKKVDELKKINDIPEKPHTELKMSKYNVCYSTNLQYSIEYIFSLIQCNPKIPFCTLNSICKMDKDVKDVKDWTETFPDKIFMKINTGTEYVDSFLLKKGSKICFTFDDRKTCFSIGINFKEYFQSIFPMDINLQEEDKTDIHGYYFFYGQKFNNYLYSDLIMNSFFSKYFCVDESDKATKKKSYLLIKFQGGEQDSSCYISCKKMVHNDTDLKYIDDSKIEYGSYYVRVFIKNFRSDKTKKFITLLSKLFTYYDEKEDDIKKEYADYFTKKPNFEIEDSEPIPKKKLNEIAPEIFVSDYPRSCSPANRHPNQIDKSKTYDMKLNEDYIEFPKETKKYCFYCDKEDYPYIGLIDNKLSNNEKYEYLPCCFQKPQTKKIEAYILDKKKIVSKQQDTISTLNRLLPAGHEGKLSDNLKILLNVVYNEKCLRVGVKTGFEESSSLSDSSGSESESESNYTERKEKTRNTRSFLNCVLTATGNPEKNVNRFYIASQENPDLTIEEMVALFHNQNEYLDPRRWIRLLEHEYKCNVVVFTLENKNVSVMTPFHKGPYLQYEPKYKDTILILEHTKEKICELIVNKDGKLFKTNITFSKFLSMTQFYFHEKNKPIQFVKYPKNVYTKQILDSYKKTRCLITKENEFLLCDPIPPLDLEIVEFDLLQFEKSKKESTQILEIQTTNHISNFSKNKKIASILSEYFIYSFSVFTKDKPILLLSNLEIVNLIKEFIKDVLVEKADYSIIPDSFINKKVMKTHGYLKDKIVVTDLETLKRLICSLRLRIFNNPVEVQTYHLRKEFLNFYESISDYLPTTNILIHSSSLCNIESISHTVYKEFQPSLSKYFFQFDKKIFIAESITDKEKRELDATEIDLDKPLTAKGNIVVKYDKYYDKTKITRYQKLTLL